MRHALQVLARLFGEGETSRLWKAMVVEAKTRAVGLGRYRRLELGPLYLRHLGASRADSSMRRSKTPSADQVKRCWMAR
jgi:hypothetical protein